MNATIAQQNEFKAAVQNLTLNDAAVVLTIGKYAQRWNARIVTATTPEGETIVVIMGYNDHPLAAASSKVSEADAYIKLANRINQKQA
jgi:hypothetical protein